MKENEIDLKREIKREKRGMRSGKRITNHIRVEKELSWIDLIKCCTQGRR